MPEINNPVTDLNQLDKKDHDQLGGLQDFDHDYVGVWIGDSGNKPSSATTDALAYEQDTDSLYRWGGSSWSKISDGSDLEDAIQSAQALTDLEDTPGSLSGDGEKVLRVNSAEDGYEHATAGMWTLNEKITRSNSSTDVSFTSLSTHDKWRLVFRFVNDTSNRLNVLLELNGVTSGTNYEPTQISPSNNINNVSNRNSFIVGLSDGNDRQKVASYIIDGKHNGGYKSIAMDYYATEADEETTLYGHLSNDSNDLSSMTVTLDQNVTGTFKLYHKDF